MNSIHKEWLGNIKKNIIEVNKIFYKIIYGKKIRFGKNVTFRKGFSIVIENGGKVEIGDGCFFNNNCSINALGNVSIGNNCLFGEGVKIYDHNHVFKNNDELIKKQGFSIGKVCIQENCWICSNVVILKDVTIGKNSVIGANCMISSDVENDNIVKLKNECIREERWKK